MTLSVKISHNSIGYPMRAKVDQINPQTGAPSGNPSTIIADGESVEFFVHSGIQLVVTEIGPKPAPDPEDAGGGPGEEGK